MEILRSASNEIFHTIKYFCFSSRARREITERRTQKKHIQQGDKRKSNSEFVLLLFMNKAKAREVETKKVFLILRSENFRIFMSARPESRAGEKRESFFFLSLRAFFISRFSPTQVRATHSTLISFGPNFIYKPENILPIPKTPINLALESTQPVDFFHSTHTRVRVTGCVLVPPDADMFFFQCQKADTKKRPQCSFFRRLRSSSTHQQPMTR